MGIYLNPGNEMFQETINSEIYVDKTGLIEYTNKFIGTRQKYICVSRPRRFGKSMTAEMLTAYYDGKCDSSALFDNLEISRTSDYKKHLNQYEVLFLNMVNFLSRADNAENAVDYLQHKVMEELKEAYSDYISYETALPEALSKIYNLTKHKFIIIIDEWDCIFREKKNNLEAQEKYLSFLRDLLKDKPYVALTYMTGILPIKKYGSHSALNMFDEYSMVDMGVFDKFTGFTVDEVKALCDKYNVDYYNMEKWYDGYLLNEYHIYNPKSVVDSIRRKRFSSYWTRTETYEALKIYLDMDFDGLKKAVIDMIGGLRCKVNTLRFQNDMTTFESKDDVLTLLIHLGYLAYDYETNEVFIPNEEIRTEFAISVEASGWNEVVNAISKSEELMEATLNGDEQTVGNIIDEVHTDTTSVLNYNNENALSCVITLAYYSARRDYTLIRELPTGKGFADIVFVPRKYSNKPAIVVELKWDKSAEGAISQIKNKQYFRALEDYKDNVILVGINYDKDSKEHSCLIEKTN